MASSQLYPNEIILDDSTTEGQLEDMARPFSRGLTMPVGRAATVYAYGGTADPFPAELLIPESEWQARIQEMEERKSRVSDLIIQAGLPSHDQDGVPYCWIHGPTGAMEALRVIQGQPMVALSATSSGCIIKNFRSEGGGQRRVAVHRQSWRRAAITLAGEPIETAVRHADQLGGSQEVPLPRVVGSQAATIQRTYVAVAPTYSYGGGAELLGP